jgi:serine/threonine protein phosphatase 1
VIYAIGDVHGRADLLGTMIAFIADHARRCRAEPQVMFLGDIVDRGPDSREALDRVVATLKRWPGSRLILGNHDLMFRKVMADEHGDAGLTSLWLSNGGRAALASYAPGAPDLVAARRLILRDFPHHLAVLRQAAHSAGDDRFLFAHAGVRPSLPLECQPLADLLQIREEFLDHVGRLARIIVHGHSVMPDFLPVVTENRISLDTGACCGGRLSCVAIDTDRRQLSFFAADGGCAITPVEPIRLDRGEGTALDEFDLVAVDA